LGNLIRLSPEEVEGHDLSPTAYQMHEGQCDVDRDRIRILSCQYLDMYHAKSDALISCVLPDFANLGWVTHALTVCINGKRNRLRAPGNGNTLQLRRRRERRRKVRNSGFLGVPDLSLEAQSPHYICAEQQEIFH
jgi:hypothetical protein